MSQNNDSAAKLLQDLEDSQTLPLWTQMTRLNPPKPNPTAVPFVWKYDTIRPNLLRAGQLVTEKQAERRVLMLVNPARGIIYDRTITNGILSNNLNRCPLHY